MALVSQPEILPGAFAAEGDKFVIPANNDGLAGLASIAKGFPPITQQPLDQGGLPPQREDFNGIFNLFSQFLLFVQNGGIFAYNNGLDYQPPCLVADPDSNIIYQCLQQNGPNTSAGVQALTQTTYWQQYVPRNGLVSNVSLSGNTITVNKLDGSSSNFDVAALDSNDKIPVSLMTNLPPSFQLDFYNANTNFVERINEGDNLNDYVLPGTFECETGAKAKTLENCPYTNGNFRLVVIRNANIGYGTQMFIANGADNVIYTRSFYGSSSVSFTAWSRLTGVTEKLYSINGYEVTNDGLQRVFGSFNVTGTGTNTFSKPFPNACLFVLATHYNATDTNNANVSFEASWTTTNVTIRTDDPGAAHTYRYMAVGY